MSSSIFHIHIVGVSFQLQSYTGQINNDNMENNVWLLFGQCWSFLVTVTARLDKHHLQLRQTVNDVTAIP